MSAARNIGSILCPNCGKLISASATECMHCGAKNPNLWGFGDKLRRLFGGQFSFVPIITAVCIAYYGISLLLDPKAAFQFSGIFNILSPSGRALFELGATGTIPKNQGFWWTVITAIYLHGSLLHIFFNLYWIRQLGPPLEEFYGVSRTFLIFTISGAVGFMVSNYFGIQFTIGASGSNFGLLAALIYYGRKRGGTFGTALYRQVGQWAIVLFIIGFIMPGVNNFAHGGGFVGGLAAAALLGFSEQKKENRTHHLLAVLCIGFTFFAFLLAILN